MEPTVSLKTIKRSSKSREKTPANLALYLRQVSNLFLYLGLSYKRKGCGFWMDNQSELHYLFRDMEQAARKKLAALHPQKHGGESQEFCVLTNALQRAKHRFALHGVPSLPSPLDKECQRQRNKASNYAASAANNLKKVGTRVKSFVSFLGVNKIDEAAFERSGPTNGFVVPKTLPYRPISLSTLRKMQEAAVILIAVLIFSGCAQEPGPIVSEKHTSISDNTPVEHPTKKGNKLVTLTWTVNNLLEQVLEYRVYSKSGSLVTSAPTNFVKLPKNRTYYVTAVNIRGESPPSQKISL